MIHEKDRIIVAYMNEIKTCKYERKSKQAHIPHSPTLLANAVHKQKAMSCISDGQSDRKSQSKTLIIEYT